MFRINLFRWRGHLSFATKAPIMLLALLILHAGAVSAAPESVLTTQTPVNANFQDNSGPYELGMEFTSAVSGKITHIRHWKALSDNAVHVGRIWGPGGTQLAQVTFADNTGSGWKVQQLTTPVSITAGPTYTVSVNVGATGDINSFYAFGGDLPVTNIALTGNNGVYIQSPGSFPNNASPLHYFRDVVFNADPIVPPVDGQTVFTNQVPSWNLFKFPMNFANYCNFSFIIFVVYFAIIISTPMLFYRTFYKYFSCQPFTH